MDRPTGVTILAVLNFIGAGLYILIGLGFILGMGIIGAMVGQSGAEGAGAAMGMLAGLGAIAGIAIIVLALIPFAIGWGLWKLRNWARIVSLVLFALGALAALAGVALGAMAGEMIGLGFNVIFLAIYAWIIWYLTRPHVKEAFGAG